MKLFSIALFFLISPTARADHSTCEQAKEVDARPQGQLAAIPDSVLANAEVRLKLAQLNKDVLVFDMNSAKFSYESYTIGRLFKLEILFSILPIGPDARRKTEKFSVIYGDGFGTVACEIEKVDVLPIQK